MILTLALSIACYTERISKDVTDNGSELISVSHLKKCPCTDTPFSIEWRLVK